MSLDPALVRRLVAPARYVFRIVLAQQVAWLALFIVLSFVPLSPYAQLLHWYRGLPLA